jgi:hypothetical protein
MSFNLLANNGERWHDLCVAFPHPSQRCFMSNAEVPTPRFSFPPHADEVAEVSLLLPAWQMHALEAAARAQGLTAGQLLRRVIAQAVTPAPPPGPKYFLA